MMEVDLAHTPLPCPRVLLQRRQHNICRRSPFQTQGSLPSRACDPAKYTLSPFIKDNDSVVCQGLGGLGGRVTSCHCSLAGYPTRRMEDSDITTTGPDSESPPHRRTSESMTCPAHATVATTGIVSLFDNNNDSDTTMRTEPKTT